MKKKTKMIPEFCCVFVAAVVVGEVARVGILFAVAVVFGALVLGLVDELDGIKIGFWLNLIHK